MSCRNCEQDGHPSHCGCPGFPVGARVLIDGEVEARVKAHFPQGSTSYGFPHYKLDVIGGDKNIAVHVARVGVKWEEAEYGLGYMQGRGAS